MKYDYATFGSTGELVKFLNDGGYTLITAYPYLGLIYAIYSTK